ncbi:hypothetical protein GCM10022223_41350 [Kineosporia mesophila]|uniref:Secreted protein n=1 Tax=Kineosporia mesophila TaxID=566012 RepID=A0ABP6ZW25_9ACTN|nr:hypothetical protein [Kineosporia mesophila]MCD5348750.1 hypothetical protein [Kineosporia mesophila]
MRPRNGFLALAAAAVPLAVLSSMSGARADQGPGNVEAGGYSVSVQIRLTGDAAPGGGGGTTVSVNLHPVCWWEAAAGPYQDAAAMLDWYDEVTGGVQSPGIYAQYGSRQQWEDAVAREEAGQDVAWWKAYCKDPAKYADYGLGGDEVLDPIEGDGTTGVVNLYRAFGAGEPIPAPLVTPDELAQAARDNMEIADPEIDRNPRVHNTDDATLVGLPTFFWVTDPASVGGAGGTRSIRADVVGAGAAVWAEVTAKTGGLDLSWPGGSKHCDPPIAIKPFSAGMSENGACTVEFTKASTGYSGGYPVEASTNWGATWRGSGNTGGTLEGLTNTVVANIPVAEVQNIVKP